MGTFTDTAGRTWRPVVDFQTLATIRRELGNSVQRLRSDRPPTKREMVTLVAILWYTCERQANERGISPEQFGRSLTPAIVARAFEIADHEMRIVGNYMKNLLPKKGAKKHGR